MNGRKVHKMKPEMKIVLVAEDRCSIGRIMAIGGIVLILITFFIFNLPDILIGDVTEDWNTNGGLYIFGYTLSIILIVLGLVAHHLAKWPEFVEELYSDGWIRAKMIYAGNNRERVFCDIPPDLLVRVNKYKKKYSRRKKMWYLRFVYDFMYDNKVYSNILYGWLKEPDDIKEFEKYVEHIKKQIEKNTEGKPVNITFSMSGYSITQWDDLDHAHKLKEERDKLIESEGEE